MENKKDTPENLENIEKLENLKKNAKEMGYEDLVLLIQEKIDAIQIQAEAIKEEVFSNAETIENLGGTKDELEKKVQPIREEIQQVQPIMEEGIKALEIAPLDSKEGIEKPKKLDDVPIYLEQIKSRGKELDKEILENLEDMKLFDLERKKEILLNKFRETEKAISTDAEMNGISVEEHIQKTFNALIDEVKASPFLLAQSININNLAEEFPILKEQMKERSTLQSMNSLYRRINAFKTTFEQNPIEGQELLNTYKHAASSKEDISDSIEVAEKLMIARELVHLGLIKKEEYEQEVVKRVEYLGNQYPAGDATEKIKKREQERFAL